MNKYDVVEDFEALDFCVASEVIISIVTEGGSEAFLKLKPGRYYIKREEDEFKKETSQIC